MVIVDAADVGGELGTQDVTLGRCSKARGSIAQAMAKHGMESPAVLDAWFRRLPREPLHPPPPHLDSVAIDEGIAQRNYALLVAGRPSPWDWATQPTKTQTAHSHARKRITAQRHAPSAIHGIRASASMTTLHSYR